MKRALMLTLVTAMGSGVAFARDPIQQFHAKATSERKAVGVNARRASNSTKPPRLELNAGLGTELRVRQK